MNAECRYILYDLILDKNQKYIFRRVIGVKHSPTDSLQLTTGDGDEDRPAGSCG